MTQDNHRTGKRLSKPLLVFVLTLVAGLAVTLNLYLQRIEDARQQKLNALMQQANDYEEQVQRWLDLFLSLNKGLAAFFSASDHVSRAEFDAYIATAEPFTQLQGLSTLGFLEQVPANQTSGFQARTQQDFPNFALKKLNTAATYYYPLVFGSSPEENSGIDALRGVDFSSLPGFNLAMEEALATNTSSASTVPVSEDEEGTGFSVAVLTPVYRPGRTLYPPHDIHAATEGFVYSTLDVDQFIGGFKNQRFSQPFSIRVYLDRSTNDRLLYQDVELTDGKTRRLTRIRTGRVHFAGHRLIMEFHQSQPDSQLGTIRAGAGTLFIGILLSLAAAFGALRLFRHIAALKGRSQLADQFSSFFRNHPFAVCSLDRQRRFVAVNPQMAAELGAPESELVGQSADRFLADNPAATQKFFAQAVSGRTVSFQHRIRRADNTEYDFAVVLIPLQSHGTVGSILCIAENITERKRLEEKLFHQANYDALTGVPNRAFFYAQLKHALARSRRTSGKLALIYLDIDEFKNVNDTYGHDIGDAVIRMFSARIRSVIRSSDLLARLGGDEFVLMVEDHDGPEGLQALGTKLIDLMQAPFVIDHLHLAVRTSVGISCAKPTMTPDDLVRQADRAMYRAKRAGRNRISIDSSCY